VFAWRAFINTHLVFLSSSPENLVELGDSSISWIALIFRLLYFESNESIHNVAFVFFLDNTHPLYCSSL